MASAVAEDVQYNDVTIGPNSKPQTQFLASRAQIAICGGSAGGGKTFGALLDVLPFVQPLDMQPGEKYTNTMPGYSAVFFRRTMPEITNKGGMWDTSYEVFGHFPDAEAVVGETRWRWPFVDGAQCVVRFTHLQHAWTVQSWDGAQVPYFYFDQLEHFEGSQFWYMQSRNRSPQGYPCLTRAGCNPDPDSFLDKDGNGLISWWIDQKESLDDKTPNPGYGYPIPSRAGKVRYLFREGETVMHWGGTRADLKKFLPRKLPKYVTERDLIRSVSFIPFKVTDNKTLMQKNPTYYGSLLSLDDVERGRKLDGNWKVRPKAGKVFPKEKVVLLPAKPLSLRSIVRYWDKAASEKKGSDWSVGVLMGAMTDSGRPVVLDVVRGQWATGQREAMIAMTAELDKQEWGKFLVVPTRVEQEPGSGGKDSTYYTITQTLPGFDVAGDRPTGELMARSRGLQSQWQVGNVAVVMGEWTNDYLNEMHNYDGTPSTANRKDDQVAASAGAYNYLVKFGGVSFDPGDWSTVRG